MTPTFDPFDLGEGGGGGAWNRAVKVFVKKTAASVFLAQSLRQISIKPKRLFVKQ
jgi:hypothetical protein